MPLPIPVRDLAIGDYDEIYGTIQGYVEHTDPKTGELQSVDLTFWNGTTQYAVNPDAILMVVQGGLNDRPPTSSVRPGLAEDHATHNH